MSPWRIAILPALLYLSCALACAGPVPDDLGVRSGRLAPCPESPNCVSTDATDGHRTHPFRLAKPADEAWQDARQALLSLPRTVIVKETADYIHAESRSPLMRFVDDLELFLRSGEEQIAVRSASRKGWSDLGANRERVWELRRAMKARGAIH